MLVVSMKKSINLILSTLKETKFARFVFLGVVTGGMCMVFAWPEAKRKTQELIVNTVLHAHFVETDPYGHFREEGLGSSNNQILIFNDSDAEMIIPTIQGWHVTLAPSKEDLFDWSRHEAFRIDLDELLIHGNEASVQFGVYHRDCHEGIGMSYNLKRSFGRWKVTRGMGIM